MLKGTRRYSATAVDQMVFGGSNVLITVIAARTLDTRTFGLFGIVFLLYIVTQSAVRALVCEAALLHPLEAGQHPDQLIGATLLISSILTMLIAAATVLLDRDLASGLIIFAALFPLLSVQDTGRYLGFAAQRPGWALALDTIWLVLMTLAIVAVFLLDEVGLKSLVLSWAGSGAVAGGAAIWSYRSHGLSIGLTWVRRQWSASWRFLASFATTYGGATVAALCLGATTGGAAVGIIRGTQLVSRPFQMLYTAGLAAWIAEIASMPLDAVTLRRRMFRISMLMSLLGFLNVAAVMLMPDAVGEAFLGQTWSGTRKLLPAVLVQTSALGLLIGPRVGLLSAREVREVLRLDLLLVPVLIALAVGGALVSGANGYLWGLALAQVIITLAWWWRFLERTAESAPVEGAAGH